MGRSGTMGAVAGWAAVAALALPVVAGAQTQPAAGPSGADDAEWRRQLESRLRRLEDENAQLRRQVGEVAETQRAVMEDAKARGILTVEGGQPRLTTPDFFDLNKYSAEGDFPGSVRIGGTKTSFQIGGYVQLDSIFDSDRIDNKDAFVVSSIPTGGEKTGAGSTNFSVRQTRLFLKTQTPTDTWGNLITYVETDFFGTDGTEPRLRHAYGQIGNKHQLLAGQTWSAFQDATVFPATLDLQGPAGMITSRRPQVRYREEFDKRWSGVIAIEDPQADVTTPAGLAGVESTPYPDLAANVRWSPDWGHLQLSGVLRYLQFDPDVGSRESEAGYGLNLSGSVKTARIDDKHVDSVLFQVAGGNGIARYINDTSGLGLDAVLAAPGGSLDGLTAFAAMVGYQHWWSHRWASTFTYSIVNIDNTGGEPPTDYHSGQYALANLRYFPTERVMIGGEVMYGIREDNDGSTGDDVRLQFSVQYRF
jgi:hypothetical protein